MKNGNMGISRIAFWFGIGALGLLMLLLMIQIDRQWTRMTDITRLMQEQAQDIRSTRGVLRNLEQTVRTARFNTSEVDDRLSDTADRTDAFERARLATQQANYAQGDWLMLAFGSGLTTLTPLVSGDAYSSEVQQYVLESLLVRDPDTLEWSGLLAEDWQISDDGLTINFTLRRDISFSDGIAMTAKDVQFTFEFIMNEAIAAPRSRAYLSRIERVTALDNYHVEFVFKEPYFNSLQLAGGLTTKAGLSWSATPATGGRWMDLSTGLCGVLLKMTAPASPPSATGISMFTELAHGNISACLTTRVSANAASILST